MQHINKENNTESLHLRDHENSKVSENKMNTEKKHKKQSNCHLSAGLTKLEKLVLNYSKTYMPSISQRFLMVEQITV